VDSFLVSGGYINFNIACTASKLYVYDTNNGLHQIDLITKNIDWTFPHIDQSDCFSLAPDGLYAYVGKSSSGFGGGADDYWWRVDTSTGLQVLQSAYFGDDNGPKVLDVSNDGQYLAATRNANTQVSYWGTNTGSQTWVQNVTSPVVLTHATDDSRLYVGRSNGTIEIRNTTNGGVITSVSMGSERVYDIVISEYDEFIIACDSEGSYLRRYDLKDIVISYELA
jgi:hypothetical protein